MSDRSDHSGETIVSRARELAGTPLPEMADAEILAAIADGTLAFEDVDETTLERCVRVFGINSVMEAFKAGSQRVNASQPSPMGKERNEVVNHEISASIYKELRRMAADRMRSEGHSQVFQPGDLAHEAYLRLADQPDSVWRDRGRILNLAARAIRHVLLEHATESRGASAIQVSDEGSFTTTGSSVDLLAIEEALVKLEATDLRQAKVVELHFFGRLSIDEIARLLETSPRTVKRDWALARAWLRRQLLRER
jgi:RNA polymerase sigma-70 factor (ECF subfamily)